MAIRTKNGKIQEVASVKSKGARWWRVVWFPTALVLALSAGGLTGILGAYYLNNSRYATEVSALATYRPPQVTKIYADDGETVLAEFAIEKRIPIKEKDIPPLVENALLSIEDYRFYDHIGVDPYRIAGVIYKNMLTGRMEGASTITQQLAKNLFLTKEQTYTRKVSEWMMALEIERFYTKRQILEMYMNYVFLGAGSYGFEAGARTYFGKTLKDLNLEEAALLAAIPKSPEYSPTRNMERARMRRNIVLDQMAKYGHISQSEAERAKATPIKLADSAYYQALPKSTAWDFPVEEIRKYLEYKYTTRVAQGGLEVFTTINVDAQKLATSVVRKRLRSFDRGRRWRSDYKDILVDENNEPLTDSQAIDRKLRSFKHADWYGDEYAEGEYIKGLVMSVNDTSDVATVRFGRYQATVTTKDMGRSGSAPPKELRKGYLAEFLINEVDDENETLQVELQQVPEIQASMVTLNAKTGEVVAMVGGYDYHTSKFNNATQGLRQTGSCYKPFIYTAALEHGITPDMLVSGAPMKRGGWQPHNYDGSLSHANVPMKIALAKSYNLAAVHLLDQVGVQTGAQMVRRFGITNPMAPSLPSALGASEASLLEMVSAYSTFPNKGVRVEPHLIRKVLDRDGKVLEEWEKTTYKVTSEYVALSMVEMMQGVTSGGGTAPGASAAGHPLAGKTGTVNDHTDVWFIGYTPTYVTGVWMGNPKRKTSLGSGMTGGGGALPFFNAFMSEFMKDKKREAFPKAPGIPTEIKALIAQRKRESLERLERETAAGKNLEESLTIESETTIDTEAQTTVIIGPTQNPPQPGNQPTTRPVTTSTPTKPDSGTNPPANPITRPVQRPPTSTKPVPPPPSDNR
ncbi:MAG: PBP1A family penicillin-binding protein [Acidobacteria bacterium]|nr:MAG: PBP1A family penicillin-binding protein [Acidobacteriota bacterium]REK02963.1 MAG: PBP1A family penicillin-binding protein [Acidobacteriota bacterium]REK13233.1 MAG: PBP1A family penicillin-binding protein [Acidobacteriota bacterium]REK41227.1 MAG: PBP1A family penicillin-binding protein [Acidobacteriota bacterium]